MSFFNLLNVPFPRGAGDGITPIDPHTLSNRVMELDAFDNTYLLSAIGPDVLCNDGDLVNLWNDIGTGGTKDGSQPTSSFRPVARDLGDFWAVEFDAVDNFMEIVDSGIPQSTFVSFTGYSVITLDSTTARTLMSCTGSGGYQQRYNNPIVLRNSVENLGGATAGPSTGVRFVDTVQYDGATIRFYRNGLANGTISTVKTFGTPTNRLGCTLASSEFFDGYMHYNLVCSEVHDLATIQGVHAFLKTRWQIA